MGTRLDQIARDIALTPDLPPRKSALPPILYAVPHSNLQLADLTAWAMLETLLLPAGLAPRIDGCGRLRAMSRDLARSADVALTDDRICGGHPRAGRRAVVESAPAWQDPELTEVEQQDQSLASANITAGFQMRQEQDVYWSADRTQRARNTRLVIKQSANSGLFPVCSEDYRVTAHTGGRITLETAAWVPGLMGIFLATKAAGLIPTSHHRLAVQPPWSARRYTPRSNSPVLLTMASIGTGSYEVWCALRRRACPAHDRSLRCRGPGVAGQGRDGGEAISCRTTPMRRAAARELIYRAHAAQSYGVTIVDDLRIEPGDILALPDGSRLYVTGFTRDLTRDAPACLDVEGFVA